MLCSLVLVALAAGAGPAPVSATRTLTVAVYTKKSTPVLDLGAAELQVSEGGQKRAVLSVEIDRSPMDVALVLDSSAAVAQAYARDLVPAALDYLKALPQGSQFAAWSTAPAKVVDFGTDAATAETRLRSVAVAGGSRALEAMTDACRALGARTAARRTLVYVGGRSLGVSGGATTSLMQAIGQNRVTPMIVLILPGGRDASLGGVQSEGYSWDVQGYFESMAKAYGGTYNESFSTMAVAEWLRRAAADASSQYSVRYGSEAEPGPLKVTVTRKDARLRAGRSRLVQAVVVGEQQAALRGQ